MILNELVDKIIDPKLIVEAEHLDKVQRGEVVERVYSRIEIPIRLSTTISSQKLIEVIHFKVFRLILLISIQFNLGELKNFH